MAKKPGSCWVGHDLGFEIAVLAPSITPDICPQTWTFARDIEKAKLEAAGTHAPRGPLGDRPKVAPWAANY